MKLHSRLLILMFSLIAISCSKDKSNRWITGKFNIVDSKTKNPVQADFKLRYYEGSILGSWETVEDIGSTDENGYFEFQQKINKRDQQFKLEVFAKGWYGTYDYFGPDATRELSKRSANILNIEVSPIYAYKLTFNNIGCYDETDSLWVSQTFPPYSEQVFTGCLDNYTSGDVYNSGSSATITMMTVSKKNGIYDTILHPLSLTEGIENEFVFNY